MVQRWIERVRGRELAARLRADPAIESSVAEAMIAIRRHRFVRWWQLLRAYEDRSLATGPGTSTSQPTYIAKVISWARIEAIDRVLEIGTGAGYTAAVLARLAREVVTVETVPSLARRAQRRLTRASNVQVVIGDGCHAVDGAFDVILVMAGAPAIPQSCCRRLEDGGRLVIPVGTATPTGIRCRVLRVTRRGDDLIEEQMGVGDWNVLAGEDGWDT
jgi:protein-L-isoaspartate(D-aspartate) O-methyltransferase